MYAGGAIYDLDAESELYNRKIENHEALAICEKCEYYHFNPPNLKTNR
jgi:hypothetical protein